MVRCQSYLVQEKSEIRFFRLYTNVLGDGGVLKIRKRFAMVHDDELHPCHIDRGRSCAFDSTFSLLDRYNAKGAEGIQNGNFRSYHGSSSTCRIIFQFLRVQCHKLRYVLFHRGFDLFFGVPLHLVVAPGVVRSPGNYSRFSKLNV